MDGPQARRAALTYERLRRLGSGNTGAAEKAPESGLPEAWAAILVRGTGTPRSKGRNGREGILSPLEAENAALAHREVSPEERARVDALLSAARVAEQDDASPAQALTLKALAARRRAISSGD